MPRRRCGYFGHYLVKVTVEDWLDDIKVPSGCTKHNVAFLREFKELSNLYSETMCYLYFLAAYLNNEYAKPMLGSFIHQKKFIWNVCCELRKRQVTTKYVPAFEREIRLLNERASRIKLLAFDNLKRTRYWVFFRNLDHDELYDIVTIFNKDDRIKAEKALIEKVEQYITEHPEEVADYMASIKDELEILEMHKAKVAAEEKAEKEAARKEKAEKKALEKEREDNFKRARSEYNKLEKSFRRYYNGNY